MKQPVDSTLPRVAIFIVKSDIEFFVWFVVKGRISISSVGVDVLDDPFSSTMILKGSP